MKKSREPFCSSHRKIATTQPINIGAAVHASLRQSRNVRLTAISNCFLMTLISLMSLWCAPPSYAQLQLKEIRTPEGLLSVHAGKGTDCFNCEGLFLNGKQLLHDQYITIEGIYPTSGAPQLVSIAASNGGNCCPPAHYILDFSVKPHIIVKDAGFGSDVAQSENGVVFTQTKEQNNLGDPMLGVYEYQLGTGKAILAKKTPIYDLKPLSQKEYAEQVLSDPTIRRPLLDLLGEKDFATFRYNVAVGDKINVLNDRIIVASGCMPHNCDVSFAMFIIDTKRKLAWAVEISGNTDAPSAEMWGVINRNEKLVASEISRWLSLHNVSVSALSMAPLSQAARDAYTSRQSESGTENGASDSVGKIKLTETSNPNSNPITPVQLFKLLAPSIYVVNVSKNNGDELQGSAVAVSPDVLLTNCHVVADGDSIILTRNDVKLTVSLVSADLDADRCILKSPVPLPNHVPIRSYDTLNIGERVYSLGAPAGLELTMSDGLLSGKRTLPTRRLVQTTAPISPGSSGGGLFDEMGNLIGITTFNLKDMENLNFAISAEDYLAR
jgi:hypothetical protein